MDTKFHPVWGQGTNKSLASPIKKPITLLRIYLAREYAKLYAHDLFIGITGSVGKTTTMQASQAVLSYKFKTITTLPDLDPILNIPKTILRLKPSIKKAIFEMGVEYPGEMDFYLSLIKPNCAIVTRIFYAHSDFLGDISEIAEEKGKLVEQLPENGIAILNYDDVMVRKLSTKSRGEVFFYGTDPKNCHVWADNFRIENFKTIFELNVGVERVRVEYKLLGKHQAYSALAAASLGIINGIPLTKIKIALELLQPSEHRMQPVAGPNGSTIIDDTYNSSPAAVEEAIDTLLQIPARRRVIVLGEMRELGKYSQDLHKEIARKIFKEKIDLVILGSADAQFIALELKSLGFLEERITSDLQNSQIVGKLLKTLGKGDICLIKGARAIRLDEVVKRIAKKDD